MTKPEHMSAWRAGATLAGIPASRVDDADWVRAYRRGELASVNEAESFLAGPETWPSREVRALW